MQQSMYQDQQNIHQGVAQQMVLCPVRVVYETQILVQPGEQIQPNQTIFLNPQNPPPWIQNRPVQNPVIYVQQLPSNNCVSSVQQHVDQNHVYMPQNFNNFQQIVPQQVISQTQQGELRAANPQIVNMMSRSIPQNMPPNPTSNIMNEATVNTQVSNFIPPQYYTNLPNQINQSPVNTLTNINNKQIVTNVQTPPKTISTLTGMGLQKNIETHQNVYRHVIPQTNPYRPTNLTRPSLPQSITMVPVPNMAVQKNSNNVPQNFNQNIGHIRPVQSSGQTINVQSNVPQSLASPILSSAITPTITRTVPLVNIKGNVTTNSVPRSHPAYVYRPIQPKPQDKNIVQNMVAMNSSGYTIQSKSQMQSSNINNDTEGNKINNDVPSSTPMPRYVRNNQTTILNRKRKSESPDEVQKKIASSTVSHNNIVLSPLNPTSCNNIAVNTSPVHKPEPKVQIPILTNQVIPLNTSNSTSEILKVENTQESEMNIKNESDIKQNNESEKLFRNTVFTQARGRLLNDKEDINKIMIIKTEAKTDENKPNLIPETKNEENNIQSSNVLLKGPDDVTKSEPRPEALNIKEENNLKILNNQLTKDMNLHNKNDDYVLTHVLDGYVIQESNIAFPIRRPLKEKTLQTNVEDKVDKTESSVKASLNKSQICDISSLHLNEDAEKKVTEGDEANEECKKNTISEDNPFTTLKPSAVRSWTVDELSTHLSKYKWEETVSTLQEHEIDGESLFLASKNQLVNIGVNEEHVKFICEFIRS